MRKVDFDSGQYDEMIVSELDTLKFVKMECPANYASISMDDNCILTITDSDGNVTVGGKD
jgi:hypothetical protein